MVGHEMKAKQPSRKKQLCIGALRGACAGRRRHERFVAHAQVVGVGVVVVFGVAVHSSPGLTSRVEDMMKRI